MRKIGFGNKTALERQPLFRGWFFSVWKTFTDRPFKFVVFDCSWLDRTELIATKRRRFRLNPGREKCPRALYRSPALLAQFLQPPFRQTAMPCWMRMRCIREESNSVTCHHPGRPKDPPLTVEIHLYFTRRILWVVLLRSPSERENDVIPANYPWFRLTFNHNLRQRRN